MQFLRTKYTRFLNTPCKGRSWPVREKSTPLREFSGSPEQERIYFSFFFFFLHLSLSLSLFLSLSRVFHAERQARSGLQTRSRGAEHPVMIIAKKLIKNAVGMYQFTFTPFRLLSSHRGVEAHIGPRAHIHTHTHVEKFSLCIGSFRTLLLLARLFFLFLAAACVLLSFTPFYPPINLTSFVIRSNCILRASLLSCPRVYRWLRRICILCGGFRSILALESYLIRRTFHPSFSRFEYHV